MRGTALTVLHIQDHSPWLGGGWDYPILADEETEAQRVKVT